MNLVISIAEHEIEMAHRWFDFVCELGGTDGHFLYLIPAASVSNQYVSSIVSQAQKAFADRLKIIKDEEGETSNWQITEPMRSASGPNSAFRQVAWYFYHNKLGPYFWCELDCIPTKKDWLDRLEAEYKVCGKPFMGAHVEIESVPVHMSGNGIYVNVPQEAPTLIMRTEWTPRDQERSFELAFDIAGAAEVIPKAHWTKLIQHKFRYEGFKSRAEFDAIIDPNAVVFHSDKSGSIFPYLRNDLLVEFEEKHQPRNLNAAPVLADPPTLEKTSGEARESTKSGKTSLCPQGTSDSRGGVQTTLDKKRAALVKARAARAAKRNLSGGVESRHAATTTSREAVKEGVDRDNIMDASSLSGSSAPPAQTIVSRTFKPGLESVIAQNAVILNGLPAMSPPWENREDTERDVKMLCEALALFAKAPVYKARVRQALREAKIIK